jgi:protein-disulfide isomerase
MRVQSTRGRKVAPPAKSNRVVLYSLIGLGVVLASIIGLVAFASRANTEVSAPTAAVGRTPEGFYYKGDPAAAVTVTAYEDYQCPACAYANANALQQLEELYINTGKVKLVYHELPLNSHANAVPAGEAARCAGDQGAGAFWMMHDLLFQNQGIWSTLASPVNTFSGYAGQLGLDRAAFDSCMEQGTHRAAVEAAGQAALAAQVQATPSFDVGGVIVDQARLLATVDAALRAAGQ